MRNYNPKRNAINAGHTVNEVDKKPQNGYHNLYNVNPKNIYSVLRKNIRIGKRSVCAQIYHYQSGPDFKASDSLPLPGS